jgi:hypothetical protein
MTDREKALEAAKRGLEWAQIHLRDKADTRSMAVDDALITVNAALAMPATDQATWEAGRDAVVEEMRTLLPVLTEHPARAVATLADHCAKLTPPEDAPAPWTPPEDRPYNYECLGWIYGGWDFVFWVDDHWQTRKSNRCNPTAFRPMFPAPKEAD